MGLIFSPIAWRSTVSVWTEQPSTQQTTTSAPSVTRSADPVDRASAQALVREPAGDPRPRNYPPEGYLKKADAMLDPWGEKFQYEAPGSHNPHSYDLWTQGADAAPGGEGGNADIGNWDAGEGSEA